MITKQAANQAYEVGVQMALEDAGLLKNAGAEAVLENPAVQEALLSRLVGSAKSGLGRASNAMKAGYGRVSQLAQDNPYAALSLGGAGVGGTAGGLMSDEDNTLAGILAGAGIGAGAGAGGLALSRAGRMYGTAAKQGIENALAKRRYAKEYAEFPNGLGV